MQIMNVRKAIWMGACFLVVALWTVYNYFQPWPLLHRPRWYADSVMEPRKKRTLLMSLFILALGILPTLNSIDNPNLKGLHGPDILRLVAIGFCVGTAFGLFMAGFVNRRGSS
jgi:hypothetical protein